MKHRKTIYALDIGNSSLKLLRCRLQGGVAEVLDAKIQRLPLILAGLQAEGDKIKVWKKALTALLETEKVTKEQKILVSLPGDLTFVRYIALPNIPVSKIKKIIRFEAEQQIPFLLSDVEWAYAVLPSRGKKEVDIVIAAAKGNLVKEMIELLTSFRFRIESFEASQLVLHNLCRSYRLGKSGIIMIDVGAHSTQVVILYKGISWGRTLRMGTFDITNGIAKELKVDLDEAEQFKKAHSADSSSSKENPSEREGARGSRHVVERITEDVLYEIANEVSRTISYYLTLVRGAVFHKIILTGGGSYIKNISSFFEKNLGMKTEIADLIPHVKLSTYVTDRFRSDKNFFHIPIGLVSNYRAKKSLSANLLSEKMREKRVSATRRDRFNFFFIIGILILFTGLLNFHLEFLIKQKKEQTLHTQITNIDGKEVRLREIEKDINVSRQKLALLRERLKERTFLPEVLARIQDILPATMWFDSVEYDSVVNVLIISGRTTQTLGTINNFANKVRSIEYVKDLTFETANIEEETADGKPVRIFTIQIRFIERGAVQ